MKIKFSDIEEQGYLGLRGDLLKSSLYTHGIIYKEKNGKFDFIHGVAKIARSYLSYSSASLNEKELDDLINASWFSLYCVLAFVGMENNKEDWLKKPFPERVSDCINYYGYIAILGRAECPFEIIME
jgi:hypothetical protein